MIADVHQAALDLQEVRLELLEAGGVRLHHRAGVERQRAAYAVVAARGAALQEVGLDVDAHAGKVGRRAQVFEQVADDDDHRLARL